MLLYSQKIEVENIKLVVVAIIESHNIKYWYYIANLGGDISLDAY